MVLLKQWQCAFWHKFAQVSCSMQYTNGVMASSGASVKAGFVCTMSFNDGYGETRKPRTGEIYLFNNMSCELTGPEFGLEPRCETTTELERLIQGNQSVWTARLPDIDQFYAEYRAKLNETRDQKERILTSSFWLYVFANDGATREELEQYLVKYEHNVLVQEIPQKFQADIDLLYLRLDYARSDPRILFWMVFWSSFWSCNKKMKQVCNMLVFDQLPNKRIFGSGSASFAHTCEHCAAPKTYSLGFLCCFQHDMHLTRAIFLQPQKYSCDTLIS